jgi:hypothetical protein
MRIETNSIKAQVKMPLGLVRSKAESEAGSTEKASEDTNDVSTLSTTNYRDRGYSSYIADSQTQISFDKGLCSPSSPEPTCNPNKASSSLCLEF